MYRPLTPWIENIKFQAAYTQNPTSEYLGDTKMQTLDSKTFQSRLEFNHKADSWLKGTLGADWKQRHRIFRHQRQTHRKLCLPARYRQQRIRHFALENFKWKTGMHLWVGDMAKSATRSTSVITNLDAIARPLKDWKRAV